MEEERMEPDAGVPDPDASYEPVTVTARHWDGTYAIDLDATVLFHGPDGVLITELHVDGAGQASAEVPPGGSVTVVHRVPEQGNLHFMRETLATIRGVQPGDHISDGRPREARDESAQTGSMSLTYTRPAGNEQVFLLMGCGRGHSNGFDQPLLLTLDTTCASPTFDILALYNWDGVRYAGWQPENMYTANGELAFSAPWQPVEASPVTVENPYLNVANLGVKLFRIVDGVPFEVASDGEQLPAQGEVDFSLLDPPVPGTRALLAQVNSSKGVEQFLRVSDDLENIDLNELPLREARVLSQTQTGASWIVARDGGDARVVSWLATWTDANFITHQMQWLLLEPADSPGGTELPALPATLAELDPTLVTGAITLNSVGVGYLELDHLDYDAIREVGPAVREIERFFLDVPHTAHVNAVATQYQQ